MALGLFETRVGSMWITQAWDVDKPLLLCGGLISMLERVTIIFMGRVELDQCILGLLKVFIVRLGAPRIRCSFLPFVNISIFCTYIEIYYKGCVTMYSLQQDLNP